MPTLRPALAALLLAASAGGKLSAQATAAAEPITPHAAILAAAEAATTDQRVVRGVFELPVRASGRQDNTLYLNSERDYRDPRCLTLAVTPAAEAELRARLGADPAAALVGRRVRVTGAAQRVTIWFYAGGRRTDKYYYQTHVPVTRAEQVVVVPDGAGPASPGR